MVGALDGETWMSRVRDIALALPLLLIIGGAVRADTCPVPPDGQQQMLVIFDLVNGQRMHLGLNPLNPSVPLTLSAQAHACDMVARDQFGHAGYGGVSQRVRAAGCQTQYSGENIAQGYETGIQIFEAWMQSPHYRNIILAERASEIGLGVATSQGGNGPLNWVMNVADGC
jgi:uncharacterized protein YkwD